jgi:hypothetical protein
MMPEKMPDRMSECIPDRMQENMSSCQKACRKRQKEFQIECQSMLEKMAAKVRINMPYILQESSRWYVRNYVRIVFQGEDHSKNLFFLYLQVTNNKQRSEWVFGKFRPIPDSSGTFRVFPPFCLVIILTDHAQSIH